MENRRSAFSWTVACGSKMKLGGSFMVQLKTEPFRKNGLWYEQVKRTEKKAMYGIKLASDSEGYHGYEVFVIKVLPKEEAFGKEFPEREKFPGNEDFGKFAWSLSTRDTADTYYSELA